MPKRTFTDQVEEIHRMLFENTEYLNLLSATNNKESVHGSIDCDNFIATQMIKAEAKKIVGFEDVASAKSNDIKKALYVVMRRYGVSRQRRRA